MEKDGKNEYVAHCLVLCYPAHGHVAPMLQFSKRLDKKGVRVTLVSTSFFCKTLHVKDVSSNITIDTISDGFDGGGPEAAENYDAYLKSFWHVGPQSLAQLVGKLVSSGSPVDCIVYDSVLPWAVDVAKELGLFGATFFTHPCTVHLIYFHAHKKLLKLPLLEGEDVISLPGLPQLAPSDLPSYLYRHGSYPFFLELVLDQFSNIDKADWILANTFYELEQEVVEWMMKIWPLKTVGPTLPSMFLDKRIQDDIDYGVSLSNPNDEACLKWLVDKPKQSVVYVSFGTMATLAKEQMEEMAWGLVESECYFLWVVRSSEESKLPEDFAKMTSGKGKTVTWCPQLQVLSHEAVGCFITHCGWNSTLEALCLGVPMVGIPQWTDQSTNAKLIADVWRMGIKARVDEKGYFTRQEVQQCVKKIMESERVNEIKNNSIYWRNMAINAVNEGGSSDNNIAQFVAGLARS